MTASWLGQMNWEVYVLETDFSTVLTEQGAWQPNVPASKVISTITPQQLVELKQQHDVAIWDVLPLAQYKKGHIPNAAWLLKADAIELIQQPEWQAKDVIVLTCGKSVLAKFAAEDMEPYLAAHQKLYVLDGGNTGWKAAGFELVTDNIITLSAQIDRYKRPYEGTDNSREAMQAYLDWEFGLVDQLKKDGTHGFFVV